MGYGSLFEYAVKALGYSEAAAGRRIAAMRLLAEVPEAEPALVRGDVSLSTLCSIQHFLQRKDEPVSREEKKELVFSLQGKSRRECERELAALDPKAFAPIEKERVISSTQTEIRFVADESLMEKLQKIRELDAHALGSDSSYLKLFHRMADLALKKLDPAKMKASMATPPPAEQSESKSEDNPGNPPKAYHSSKERYIPSALKRAVWHRDQGRCAFQSKNGRRCGSRFALEIDHRTPLALGGKTELGNLRLLCRSHNSYQAITLLGSNLMQNYVR
jgi:5-methylcytosine-specific restriction endonuclease McrA